jgi:ceramide glucosyltransferase
MVVLQALLGGAVVASWFYYLVCLLCARHWRSQRLNASTPQHLNASTPQHLPPVSILKPVRGTDPEQYANFESFCKLEYPCYQLVFGALDADDPGLDTARRLAQDYPDHDIAVVEGGNAFGLNRKVCNLENMRGAAAHDLYILCDSDMRVAPDYLHRVVAPFASPRVGLVTSPYRGHLARGLASKLEALGIGADFIPSAFVAYYLWRLRFAFGSTIAIRKDVLDEIGGFRPLADQLADDYLLAHRTEQAGYEVVLSDYVVDDVLGAEPFGEMWSRRLRWAKTSRLMRPGPYAGSFVTNGIVLALLFLLTSGASPIGWGMLGVTLAVRGVVATYIARSCTDDESLPRLLPLLPLSDLVSFALFVCSFWGRHIVWRGERLRVLKGGRLERVFPEEGNVTL